MTQHFERPKFQGILEYYLNSNCELDTQLNEFKQGNPQYHQLNNQNLQMPPALKRNMRLVIIEIIPQILVSDGHNFIEAIFSKESINEFRRHFSHVKFSNLRDKVIYVSKWSLQIDSVDSQVEFNSFCNFTVRLVVEQFKPILHETLNSRLTHGAQSIFRNHLIQTLIKNFRHWFAQQMIETKAINEQQEPHQFAMPELSAIFDPKKRGTNLNQSQLPTQLSDDNSDTINNFGAIIQKTEVFRFQHLDFEEKKGLSDMPLFSEHILIKKKNQSRELRIADMDRIIIQEKGEQYYADKKFSKSRQWHDQVADEVLREELKMKIEYFQVGTKTIQTISSHFETVKQKEDRERLLRNKSGYRSNRRIVGYTLGHTASSIKEKLLKILNHNKKRALSTATSALQAAPNPGEPKRKRANSQENILKMQAAECNTKQEPTEFFDHTFIGNRSREPLSQYVVNQMPNFNDDTQSEQDSLDAAINVQLENERKNKIAYQDAQIDHVMNVTQDMLKVTMFRKYLNWFENNETMRNTEDSHSKSDQNASATKSSQNHQFIDSNHDVQIRQEQGNSQEQMQDESQNVDADQNDRQRQDQRRDDQNEAQQQQVNISQQNSNPILNIEDVSMNHSSQQTVTVENTEKIIKVEHEEPSQAESEQFVSKYTMGESIQKMEQPGEIEISQTQQYYPIEQLSPPKAPQNYADVPVEAIEAPLEVEQIFNLDENKAEVVTPSNIVDLDQFQEQLKQEVIIEPVAEKEDNQILDQLEKTLEELKKNMPKFEQKEFVPPQMNKPQDQMTNEDLEFYEIELEMAQSDHEMEEKIRKKQHLTQKKAHMQKISQIKEQIQQEKQRKIDEELERQRKIKEQEELDKIEKARRIQELEEKLRQQKLKEEQERLQKEQEEKEERERIAAEEEEKKRQQAEKEEQERLRKAKEEQEEEERKQRLLAEQEKQRQINLQKKAELQKQMELLNIQKEKEKQQQLEEQAIIREKERQKALIIQKQRDLLQQKQMLEQKNLQQQQQIDELDWEEGDQFEIKRQEQERYDQMQNGYVEKMSSKFGHDIDNEVRRLQGKDIVRRQVKNNKNPDKLYDLLQISEIAKNKKERKDQLQMKADLEKKQQENFQDAQLACSGIVFTQEENSSFNNNRHVDEEFVESNQNQTESHHSSPEKMEQVENEQILQQTNQVQIVETHDQPNKKQDTNSSYSEIEEDEFNQQYLNENKPSDSATEVVELSSGLNNEDIEEINVTHMSPQKDEMVALHDQRQRSERNSSNKKQRAMQAMGSHLQQVQHIDNEEEQFYDEPEEDNYQDDENEDDLQYQSPESFNKSHNQVPAQQMQNQFQLMQQSGIQVNDMSNSDPNSQANNIHLKLLQDQIANLQNQLTNAMQSINVMASGGSQGNMKQGAPIQQTQGQQHAVKSFDCRSVDDVQDNGLHNSLPSVSSEEDYQVPTFGSNVQKNIQKDKRQAQYAELQQQGVGSKRKFVQYDHHRERSRSQEANPRGIQVQDPQYGMNKNDNQTSPSPFANLTEFANIQRMQEQRKNIQEHIHKHKQQKLHNHRMHKHNMKMPNGDNHQQNVNQNNQMQRQPQHQRPMQSQGGMKPVNGHQQQQRNPQASRDRDSQREYHQQRMMQQSQQQRGQMMQSNPNMRQRGSSVPNQGMCGQQQVQPMRQQQSNMQRSPQRQPMNNHMSQQQMGSGQKNNMMRSSKQGSPRSPPRGMTQAKNIGQNKRYMHSQQQMNGHNAYAQDGQPMKLKQSPSQSHVNQQRIQQVQWQYSSNNPQAQKRRRIDEQ